MHTITVSIGRNIGNTPMPDDDWERFTTEATRILASAGPLHFVGLGEGIYEGMREESYTIVSSAFSTADIRYSLARLADAYGQECIAMSIGATDFVYAQA